MEEHFGVVFRYRLRRDAGHGGDCGLDLLDADGALAPAFRQQHLRRTQLVDHVDGFVGKLAVVDVARRQFDRRLDGFVGVPELVIVLEIGLEPLEDFDRIRNRGLIDVDLLEPAHQRSVLLEILPVFLVSGRADAAHRARRQCGLEQIRRIHRATGGGARADHGVDFVDEQDGAGIGLKLLDDLLEPFLEIAAIARAGKERAHVECEHGRVAQHVGHFAMNDAARQPFGNRGLADAGVADEQRIVLRPSAEYLNSAADLGVAADQRVDLALARLLVEVDAVSVQRIALLLRLIAAFGIGVLVGAAHRPRFRHARPLGNAVADVIDCVVARHVLLLQEICGVALTFGEDRDQHIGASDFLASG